MSQTPARSRSRSAARLAAVQALYQQEMEKTPLPILLHEFHQHRLGATIEDVEYADAEVDFFDDVVKGVDARSEELDAREREVSAREIAVTDREQANLAEAERLAADKLAMEKAGTEKAPGKKAAAPADGEKK